MVSVAGVPSKVPSSCATIQEIRTRTEISILTCRHAKNVALAGEIMRYGTIIITFHAALHGLDTWSLTLCSNLTLLRPIYKRYLYILIFEHP